MSWLRIRYKLCKMFEMILDALDHLLLFQVEYHPYQQPNHLIEYCRKEGIVFEGYSPLAKGQVLSDPTVQQIAKKHKQTPAKICIRWSIQVATFVP